MCQKYFSQPKPFSSCNLKKPGNSSLLRAINRADINCETLTWQYETLGDGNVAEFEYNKCPIPKHRATLLEGALRKSAKDRR